MAGEDAKIEVLIQVVDEMSDKLNKIEDRVQDFSEKSVAATENVGKSYVSATNQLIALGNTANSVDNIFDSYQNMQLRVENSQERVNGATDRLEDAQRRLARTMDDSKASAEDVADAQREVERATRTLTIAENNQAKTNNVITGTYISMGVQLLSVAQSLPMLIAGFTGVGGAILAGGVAVAGLTFLLKDNEEVQNALKGVQEQLLSVWQEMSPALMGLLDAIAPIIPPIAAILEFFIKILATGITAAIKFLAWEFKGLSEIIVFVVGLLKDLWEWFGKVFDKAKDFGGKVVSNVKSAASGSSTTSSKKIGDGIIKPDGTVIETDPRDTLVAMKDVRQSVDGLGGSGVIYVTIDNIYGTSPTEISKALKKELASKLVI